VIRTRPAILTTRVRKVLPCKRHAWELYTNLYRRQCTRCGKREVLCWVPWTKRQHAAEHVNREMRCEEDADEEQPP
jgi:hypothetical protein